MNCQNFENVLDDIERGALLDARSREAALAHRDSCGLCTARFSDQSAIRAGLRSLAASAADADAPARVEAALLAAFRAQAGAAPGAPVADSNVRPLVRRAEVRQWSWVKTFATAATAAAAAAVLLMIIPPGTGIDLSSGGDTVANRTAAERAPEVQPPAGAMIEPVPTLGNAKDQFTETADATQEEPPRFSQTPRGGSRMTTTPVSYNPAGGRRAQGARGGSRGAARDQFVATDFIPLGHGEYSASVDAGQVVRVELPRSALSSIGLPVSADRAGERIKADVLIGEDGVARAIRFVR